MPSFFLPKLGGCGLLALTVAIASAVPPVAVRDLDSDQMDDLWESAHGLSPALAADALIDSDGDGQTNRLEYWFGTDPQNAHSLTRLEVTLPGGAPRVQWSGIAHKRYQIEFAPALAPASWTGLGEARVGTGAPLVVDDTTAAPLPPRRFYRAQALASFDRDRDRLDDWLETAVYGSHLDRASSSGSGVPDGWAVQHGLNPNTVTAGGDGDGDGAGNLSEYHRGTSPAVADGPSGEAATRLRVFTPLNR